MIQLQKAPIRKRLSDFTPDAIQKAREAVADFFALNAWAIHKDDEYGPHVTAEEKKEALEKRLAWSEAVRRGEADHNFAAAQRIWFELTGECVALLPKY